MTLKLVGTDAPVLDAETKLDERTQALHTILIELAEKVRVGLVKKLVIAYDTEEAVEIVIGAFPADALVLSTILNQDAIHNAIKHK